jgi:hypothetical protein
VAKLAAQFLKVEDVIKLTMEPRDKSGEKIGLGG